ncbi:MAG TPA: hypothetical protein VN256_07130 [Pyrinomonadaceae bacterium]|nr:hypothetical protein [Pyrinomonadaceae bacterium]
MPENRNIDEVRGSVLDRIERSERHYRTAFVGAAVVEAAFLAGFLFLADLSNRTHVLLLIATVAIYTLLGLSLMALGNYINRSTLRVLKAVELLANKIN